jgi:aldose 1-epimerase
MNGPFTSTGEPLDTRLYVTIGAKWLLNDRGNPTGDTIPLDNHDKQYQTGSMIPVKHKLDNDVYNMDTDEVDGRPFRGAIATDIATGKKIFYEVDDNFKFWVLWNDGGEKGFFCPEPMTWMINAPNLPLSFAESGYLELAPGQSKTVYEHIYSTK